MRHSWLLFAAVLAASLMRRAAGRAALEGDAPAFDAGTVHAGDLRPSHRFVLTNRGSETVEIVETRPSCGSRDGDAGSAAGSAPGEPAPRRWRSTRSSAPGRPRVVGRDAVPAAATASRRRR